MLTTAQNATLKAFILATPALAAQPNTSDGAIAVAAALNVDASPAFVVWNPQTTPDLYRAAITWTEFTGRSAGERDMFAFLTGGGTMDLHMDQPNVRQAVNDAFSGPSGALSRAAIRLAGQRNARLIEKVLATGTGDAANPATMGFVGEIGFQDVQTARA